MKALNLNFQETNKVVQLLRRGKIGVMPTDTIYGIVGSALNPSVVEEVYFLRKRDTSKPMIILISSLEDLLDFDISLTKQQKLFLTKIWPNPVSVVLPCPAARLSYLHRGKKSLAFRMPKNEKLLKILKQVGSLVAPSANSEKGKPAQTVAEARKYFNDKVAFYVDQGELKSEPSTIIRLYEDGARMVLREGKFNIEAYLSRCHKCRSNIIV